FDRDRVTDTLIRQQLLDNAAGILRGRIDENGRWRRSEYALDRVAPRVAGVHVKKDAVRLSFGPLRDVPLAQWPERVRGIQTEAAARLAKLEARAVGTNDRKRRKEIEDLRSMIASDPKRWFEYATEDVTATLAVFVKQEAHAEFLADQFRQARAAF